MAEKSRFSAIACSSFDRGNFMAELFRFSVMAYTVQLSFVELKPLFCRGSAAFRRMIMNGTRHQGEFPY